MLLRPHAFSYLSHPEDVQTVLSLLLLTFELTLMMLG